MSFFENTRKPQGFGGRIMVKMMNSGHSKLAKWGFTKIYAKSNAKVLDIGCGGGANIANWLAKCTNGHVSGIDYSKVSVEESEKLNAIAIKQTCFEWYLNFDLIDKPNEEKKMVWEFPIEFQEAKSYRTEVNSLLRPTQWQDLLVRVYV